VDRGASEVERELGGERAYVERHRGDRRRRFTRDPEHEHRPEHVPAVREAEKDTAEMDSAADVVDRRAGEHACSDEERHLPDGEDEKAGTRTTCVGTAEPVPTSKRSRKESAYVATRRR
jgi:hypothetical protein